MDQTKILQNTSSLNKNLVYQLTIFEKNKEWADITQWVTRVQNSLLEYPSPYIKDKLLLTKRLAQCLNPALPNGIHEITINIYSLLLKNMRLVAGKDQEKYNQLFNEDIGMLAVGLFPFYQNASFRVKEDFLKLISEFFIPVKRDLIPCLPGLLLCLLPGLDDNNEQIKKALFDVLDQLFKATGRRYFIGSLWMAIMRQQRGRAQGIKLLQKYIPKSENANNNNQTDSDSDEQEQEDDEEEQKIQEQDQQQQQEQKQEEQQNNEEIDENQQDNENNNEQIVDNQEKPQQPKMKLVAQASSQSQKSQQSLRNEQQSQQILSGAKLEFEAIEENIDDNNDINNFPNISTIVLNTVIRCLQDENVLVKRTTLEFLNSHLNMKKSILKKQDQLIITETLLYLFQKKEGSTIKKANVWLFGKPDIEGKFQVREDNLDVIDLLKQAFKNIFKNSVPKDTNTALMPVKILQNFYMEHEDLVELTLKDISIEIIEYIYLYHDGYEFSQDVKKVGRRFLQSIPYHIELFLNSLSEVVVQKIKEQNDEQCLKVINLIKFTFENLLKLDHFEGFTARGSLKHTLSGIFKSFATLSQEDISKFQFIQPALTLVQQLVDKLEIIDYKIQEEDKTKFFQTQSNIGSSQTQQNQEEQATNNTNNSQQNSMLQSRQQQGNSFDNSIQDYCTFYENFTKTLHETDGKTKIKLMKAASLVLIKIQKFLTNKQVNQLPNWFKCVTQSIKMKNPRISLVAIEAMIEILISEKKDPIYETLKNLILEETKAKQRSDTLISGSDYTKVTLEKLWSLLDFQYYHEQIIDLILNFSKYFPQFFKEVVVNSFQIFNIAEQEAAIRRFASFWKLTQQNYQQKQLLIELNKVGLFLMLEFLDHDNPLLRNASKNWLLESSNQLYRIIDPLFEVLIQPNSNFYETDQGQLIYTKQYETKKTSETFRKLKSILVNASDMFSKYISNKELSKGVSTLVANFTTIQESFLFRNTPQNSVTKNFQVVNQEFTKQGEKQIVEKNLDVSNNAKKMTYLDLLVLVCLKYIQGQALESMSAKFHIENAAVNASSCEFLEYLISYFEDAALSMRLCQYVLEPLLKVFNNCIINKEYVMQISLLNLFKVIFFRSAFANKITETVQRQLIFTPVLCSPLFIPNILRGLNTEISYIKQQFVNFISQCLPIICQNLHHPMLTNQIKSILYCYSNLIQQYGRNLNKQQDGIKIEQVEKQGQEQEEGDIIPVVEDNDDDHQNSYEISILLKGVSEILQYFLKIQDVNKDESIMNLHNKSNSSVMGGVASVLTLGLYTKSDQRDKVEYQFDKYKETCECILFDIQKVIEMFILSWKISSSFNQISQNFTKLGVPYYIFQQFNNFNTRLSQMVEQLNSNSQKGKVKHIIVSSLQSLLFQYPQIIMNTILKLWIRECAKEIISFETSFPKTAFMSNLIEILIIANPQSDFILEALYQSDYIYRVQQNYAKKHPKEKKNHFILNVEYASEEARILYFIYVYFSYSLIDGKALKKENLLPFWMQILKILRIFSASKNPSTALWIIELVYMLSKKYSPKEILNETSFKKQLHELLSDKLIFLANVASQNFTFVFNVDPKEFQMDKKKKDPKHQQPTQQTVTLSQYTVILPLTPTQFEMASQYQQYQTNKKQKNNQQNQADLQPQHNPLLTKDFSQLQTFIQTYQAMFENISSTNEEEIYQKYKIYILKTFKFIALDLLQNTYAPEKSERIVSRTKEFMEPLFTVIEDKSEKNSLYLESCSEVLNSLLERSPALLFKEFKKPILDIFNKDNFFSQSKSTLKYWKKIINKVVEGDMQSDIFGEYLSRVTLSGSFFSKESTINNTRIKSFKRVCFIIFSGEVDQYFDKLKILLDKISEVIKNAETIHPSLLILILFCIRILILRLSNANLKNLFRQIWPMLITLLIQIYSSPQDSNQKSQLYQKSPNLLLAGLKLIEILSISQFDEFYLHQWIFVFDYFGLQVEPQSNVQKIREMQKNNKKKNTGFNKENKKDQMTPFYFQPYMSNCMPNQEYFRYVNQSYQDDHQTSYQERTRRIIMTQSIVDDEIQLQYQAWQLCLYLISCNEYRQKVENKVIEDLIEDDFIQLDESVLKN